MTSGPMTSARARRAAALTHGLAVTAPLMTMTLVVLYIAHHEFAVDFRDEYWVAARRVLQGRAPYAWSQAQIAAGVAFPYPAVIAVLLVPLALLPVSVGTALFVTILLVSVAVTLWILSVRDWRVYAITYLLFPVISAWQTANVTLLLGLLLALAWRYRDRPPAAGLLVALAVSVKPFVWPLALWLLVTRRYGAGLWALAGGLAMNAAAWGIVGYGQVGRYLQLDHRVTATLYRSGYSLVAIAARLGASEDTGLGVLALTSAAVAALCLWLGLHRRDDAAFAVSVGLMPAASPLVWNHYVALLIVPLAITRPRLSREWLTALPLWLCPGLHVCEWQALLFASFTVGTVVALSRSPRPHRVGPFLAAPLQLRRRWTPAR